MQTPCDWLNASFTGRRNRKECACTFFPICRPAKKNGFSHRRACRPALPAGDASLVYRISCMKFSLARRPGVPGRRAGRQIGKWRLGFTVHPATHPDVCATALYCNTAHGFIAQYHRHLNEASEVLSSRSHSCSCCSPQQSNRAPNTLPSLQSTPSPSSSGRSGALRPERQIALSSKLKTTG